MKTTYYNHKQTVKSNNIFQMGIKEVEEIPQKKKPITEIIGEMEVGKKIQIPKEMFKESSVRSLVSREKRYNGKLFTVVCTKNEPFIYVERLA